MFHSGVVKDPELGNSVCLCSLTQLENISEQPGEEYWQCLKLLSNLPLLTSTPFLGPLKTIIHKSHKDVKY